jgi:hypothetical protein
MSAHVDFCGELYPVTTERSLIIGRDGDLAIEDNPYLHRHFLDLSMQGSLVWLANVGAQLSATVSDEDGLMQAWLGPGARIPLVFAKTIVWFTAGPTTYEFDVLLDESPYQVVSDPNAQAGTTPIGRMALPLIRHY